MPSKVTAAAGVAVEFLNVVHTARHANVAAGV